MSRRLILLAAIVWPALCLDLSFAQITDANVYVPPQYLTYLPPGAGQSYTDPVFATTIKRMSNALGQPNADGGGYLTFITDEYSSMSPFNNDNSKVLMVFQSYFALYDGAGNFIKDCPLEINAMSEPRWSRTDANVLYYHKGNQLKQHNVSTGAISVVHTFGEYSTISGKGESDICFDGSHFVFVGDNRYVFVFDINTKTKSPVLDTAGRSFDSVYITPNDNVTVTWLQVGSSRFNGIELFDRNMNFLRQLSRAGGHMDVTRDSNGEEVLLLINAADPVPVCDNAVVKIRLSDGQQTCLVSFDWSLAVHVSAPDNSGWCFVSTYAPSDPVSTPGWTKYTNEVLRVKLDGSSVQRLAHHRSRPLNSYNYQAHVSVSRDGSKLVYNSNFGLQSILGYPTEYSDVYLMTVGSSSPPTNTLPTGSITQPGAGALYKAGDTITYAGTGTDPEDGNLPASAFTWQVDFHHDTHLHPFIPATSGAKSGSFTIPTTGETSPNVWYRIHLKVKDSGGLIHASYVDILPRKSTVTLATNPSGLQIRLDGLLLVAPTSFTGVVGIVRSIEAVSPQTMNGTNYEFDFWSDGGAAARNIATPASNTTYTATYRIAGGGGTGGLPSPWSSQDIGSVGIAGSASYSGSSGTFTVKGSGMDIWNTADAFRYVYQPLNGNGEILARVTSVGSTDAWAKAGVMIRESLAPGSAYAMMLMSAANGTTFQRRLSTGGNSFHTTLGGVTAPYWVRLVRSGNTFTGYYSANGSTWQQLGSQTITMASSATIGLAVTSHNNAALNTSSIDNVTVNSGTPPPPPPSGWLNQDIGSVGIAGSYIHSSGTYNVKGSGADIWYNADAFHYVYQTLNGNGEIVARVTGVQNTDSWAKAGVMIRESLAPSSAYAMMLISAANGTTFQRRPSTGGNSFSSTLGGVVAPYWVRLVRSGNTFTGYYSANGSTWQQLGSQTISMSSVVTVGLAVTSHNNSALNTSTIDNVTIK